MDVIQIIEKSTLIINSVLLLFLGVRHIQEMQRHRSQLAKLELELEALKRASNAANQLLTRPSEKDIETLVVRPITQRLDQMTNYLSSSPADAAWRATYEATAEVQDLLRLMQDNSQRLAAAQNEFLALHEQLFRTASGRIQEAISDGLKDVRLEFRVDRDTPKPDL